MSDFKEFQGKNLDEAIQAACDYYEVARAKLEIEILSGGSTGIFGLVGVRKASVKARPRRGVKSVLAEEPAREQKQSARQERTAGETAPQEDAAPAEQAREHDAPQASGRVEGPDAAQPATEAPRSSRSRRGRKPRQSKPAQAGGDQNSADQSGAEQTGANAPVPENAGQAAAPQKAAAQQKAAAPQKAAAQEKPRQPRQRRQRQEKPKETLTPEEAAQAEFARRELELEEAPKRPARRPVHEANPAPIPADRHLVPDFPPDDADDMAELDDLDDLYDMDFNGAEASDDPEGGSRGPSLEGLDQEKLQAVVTEAATALLKNLTPEPRFKVVIESDRVHVLIDDEEHSGLIIGREGQTLSALQYLANRIVSRRMETSVRVQLDTGDYRERQDDKLRQQARRLADKAILSRRTQSTKPLSSYHRRVVHLTVQEMPGVLTRSKGEGPLKRVLIVPKKRSR